MHHQTKQLKRWCNNDGLLLSLIKLNQKLQTNFDRIPHGVSRPLIKPKTIDDVPILALTFHPELTGDTTIHKYFVRRVVSGKESNAGAA